MSDVAPDEIPNQAFAVGSDTPDRSASDTLWRAIVKNPLGLAASATLLVVLLLAVIGPYLVPHDPNAVDVSQILSGPSSEHWLGVNGRGQDVLARLVHGARNTLMGAAIAVVIGAVLGTVSGLIAGYFGRGFDAVSSWIANILLALPALIMLLALYQSLGASINAAMAVFGVRLSPGFFRLVRNQVIGVKNELYVDAAKVSGLRDSRIIGRHVLGVVRSPVIIQLSIVAGIAIIIQSVLSFLGITGQETPTWGGMLRDAFDNLYLQRLLLVWPGLAISLTVMSFVLLANAIRDGLRRQRAQTDAEPQRQQEVQAVGTVDELPPDADDALLVVRDLAVGYGPDPDPKVVVDGVDFHVRRGEVLGLVGESGSGKSQTSLAILGLLPRGGRVLRGSVTYEGTDLVAAGRGAISRLRGRSIAYIPQEPMSNLDPAFTVGAQLVEPLRAVGGLDKAEARAKALQLLDRVGIADPQRTFDAYPHEISGGMAQRVLIAGAISCEPDLLIADEPTTALDVTIQADLLDLLRELQAEYDMAVLLVTHDFGVVADICDRVVVMQSGAFVEANDVDELFADPRHPYTRTLLASTMDDAEPREPLTATGGPS